MAAKEPEISPKPADLIQVFRGLYEHWAIYIQDGDVVHFGSDTDESLVTIKTSKVMRQKLAEVVGTDRFCVNNELDNKYTPRDTEKVVEEALHLVGEELPYSLSTSNCEHFVTGLRYGKQESVQVREAVGLGALGVVGGALAAVIGLGAVILSKHRGNKEEQEETTVPEPQQDEKNSVAI